MSMTAPCSAYPPCVALLDGAYAINFDGAVTVETYQWFVRHAGHISDVYTIVICDEAHTALGEKTSRGHPPLERAVFIGMTATGALIARHVTNLFPTEASRLRSRAKLRGAALSCRCAVSVFLRYLGCARLRTCRCARERR